MIMAKRAQRQKANQKVQHGKRRTRAKEGTDTLESTSAQATPGAAEGDLDTVEQDLEEKGESLNGE
jgi:hypothetical protein